MDIGFIMSCSAWGRLWCSGTPPMGLCCSDELSETLEVKSVELKTGV